MTNVINSLLVVISSHIFGMFGLYEYPVFQKLTHLIGGVFFGYVGIYYGFNPITTALLGGIAWEIFESIIGEFLPAFSRKICWYSDTIDGAFSDIFMGVAGSALLLL